ncbi:MAG: hypothetical protein LLG37_03465 [Spirochaetia bacterium]|nr:hypothetical protein [Spirochaetia bacterium]
MAQIRNITHNGRKILLMDFTYSKPEEMLSAIEDAKNMVKKHPKESVYCLVDVRFSPYEYRLSEALKELAFRDRPYIKVTAVVGVTGFKKLAYMAVQRFTGRRNLVLFDRIETAKDWLSNQ